MRMINRTELIATVPRNGQRRVKGRHEGSGEWSIQMISSRARRGTYGLMRHWVYHFQTKKSLKARITGPFQEDKKTTKMQKKIE